jgi:hypothetical protein
MTEKYDTSSLWIESNFFFSVGGYVYEITFDTIKTSILLISR